MDILSYLAEILQQRKEVGITGLGTFYKKKFAGRYDKEKQLFLPPSYSLLFSSDVRQEEVLVDFIAEKENISVESAHGYIQAFSENINKQLEMENEAVLNTIGRLFHTEQGLAFEPEKALHYGSEFFGLPEISELNDVEEIEQPKHTDTEAEAVKGEVHDKPATELSEPFIENVELDEVKDDLKNTLKHSNIHQQDVSSDAQTEVPEFVKEQHEEHPNRFGHQPESEAEETKTYINLHDKVVSAPKTVETPEFIKEQHAEHPNRFGHNPLIDETISENKTNSSKVLITVLALFVIGAIIAVLAYALKPEWFNQKTKQDNRDSVVISPAPVAVKTDSLKIKQDSIAKTDSILKANQVQKKIDIPKPVLKSPTTGKTTFEVIGTSVRTLKRADDFVNAMKKYGIEAKIIKGLPGKLIKVSIGSFSSEAEARAQKPLLEEKIKTKGLYIEQIKPTL